MEKKKNSSKFRVSTGQNFFRWARFARQTVHRGNTTRISLLGKHVGRNRLLNTLIETETWAPMKGVCFKTCHLQYRHWPSIRYWLDVEERPVFRASDPFHAIFLLHFFLRYRKETNTMGYEIDSLSSCRIQSLIWSNSSCCLCFRFSTFNHRVNWSGGNGRMWKGWDRFYWLF